MSTGAAGRSRLSSRLNRLLWQVALTLGAAVWVAPIIWMLSTSLKDEGDVLSATPRWIPEQPTLGNYHKLFVESEDFPVLRWLYNSVGVSLATTFLVLVVTSTAAFAFSRLQFRGRDGLFLLVVATMMIPAQVALIPVFLIVQKLGLFNTYAGLVVPGLASAFGVFLLRQFFLGIPRELEEATFLDGGGHWIAFTKIVLPLSKPALATLAIFTFIGSWNDFVWPLIVTSDIEMRTLPVGIQIFQGRYLTEYGKTMAAATITTVPMIIAFLIFQRRITEGIALTGLKG
ncbi:MAG TPA: carbohydrate ABC transporter permease [Fimbriimonadaceae bacterium]|nr:carbohydrate ABC transporter permease [Fimbriimonadaceae bacterium]